jgi:hypothetical protein
MTPVIIAVQILPSTMTPNAPDEEPEALCADDVPEGRDEVEVVVEALSCVFTPLDDDDTVELKPVDEELPEVNDGGGTALLWSTRWPVPHGIGSFEPGCLGLAGGVEEPDDDAMVKRVVQVLVMVCGDVNW